MGDIHGRADLLSRVLAKPGSPLICVGDYIDRGPESADVLRMLAEHPDAICLMGNHEEMLLSFLHDPARYGPRWLRHGGDQTVASFGLRKPSGTLTADAFANLKDDLCAVMGQDLIDWLRGLPSFWRLGNVAVVHAAADPARALDAQTAGALRWGHPAFPNTARRDGVWIVHGHVVVPAPRIRSKVVSIDTGAWATDRLTVAHIGSDGIRFETA